MMSKYGWRVFVTEGPSPWLRDEIPLMIGNRTPDGMRIVRPTTLELGDPIAESPAAPSDDQTEPSLVLPTELAAALFSALAPHLVGAPDHDLVATIKRLVHERDRVTSQLEKLIDGIGRLGGHA